LVIPENVITIGDDAFLNCSSLQEVKVLNETPITDISENAFYGSNYETQCVLRVPNGSMSKYTEASVWKDFKNIKEMSSEMGDANDDGKISIADAVIMIDYILNRNPENFNAVAADMNGDSQVTMTDVIQVLDKILKAQ
jgi:hypothetical protein